MFDKLKVEQLVSGRRLSVNVYLHLSNFQAFSMYSFMLAGQTRLVVILVSIQVSTSVARSVWSDYCS